jgi:hypothetical protein
VRLQRLSSPFASYPVLMKWVLVENAPGAMVRQLVRIRENADKIGQAQHSLLDSGGGQPAMTTFSAG